MLGGAFDGVTLMWTSRRERKNKTDVGTQKTNKTVV